MTFDVQNADLDQLAEIASTGGIAALEELANGKQPELKTETPAEAEATHAEAEGEKTPTEETPVEVAEKRDEKEHATAVSTKDGKGTIPYSVLKGARERASQFEQENSVLRQQLEELTGRMQQGTPETAAADVSASVDEADGRIEALRSKVEALKGDFPELAELFEAQLESERATRKQLISLQERYEAELRQREEAESRRTAETVQEAIDRNPALTLWQQKAGPEWQEAVEQDARLRQKPEWAEKSFDERFARVVEIVKVTYPEAELPSPQPTSTKKQEQADPSKRPPVNSLSDIPGGVPPAAGTREQIEDMSVSALGNRFMTMTESQIQDYLASLAS